MNSNNYSLFQRDNAKRPSNDMQNPAEPQNKFKKIDDNDASIDSFLRRKRTPYEQNQAPKSRLQPYRPFNKDHLEPSPFHPASIPNNSSINRYTITQHIPSALGNVMNTQPTMTTINPAMLSRHAPPLMATTT